MPPKWSLDAPAAPKTIPGGPRTFPKQSESKYTTLKIQSKIQRAARKIIEVGLVDILSTQAARHLLTNRSLFLYMKNGQFLLIDYHTSRRCPKTSCDIFRIGPWLEGQTRKRSKLEDRYSFGVWLGICLRTDEVFIGTASGQVVRARSVRRLPEHQQVNLEMLKQLKGRPWAPIDGEAPGAVPIRVREAQEEMQQHRGER